MTNRWKSHAYLPERTVVAVLSPLLGEPSADSGEILFLEAGSWEVFWATQNEDDLVEQLDYWKGIGYGKKKAGDSRRSGR